MRCCITPMSDGKKVLLVFKREELLYDIKNYAYIENHIMPPQTEHARHMVADVGECGNVDRVTRVLSLAVCQCREALYPYAKRAIDTNMLDDTLEEPCGYCIELSLPPEVSQTTIELLENLIHEYLVCRGIADWLSITNTEKSEVWLQKAMEAESELRSALSTRMQRVRIRQHWLS